MSSSHHLDEAALEKLAERTYDEMRGIAHHFLRDERRGHTLGTTALVHEVYLRLAGMQDVHWTSQAQFFTLAPQAMRRILVDYARSRAAKKRGDGRAPVSLDNTAAIVVESNPELILDINEALTKLAEVDSRIATVVELRYFVGFSVVETAKLLEVSRVTVSRDWTAARAWLFRYLQTSAEENDES